MPAVEVRVSANYDRWVSGFGNLKREAIERGKQTWETATEVFFDRTQEYAHVVTGEMKASGHAEVDIDADGLVGVVAYDSDHAVFEERRGGSHALITRGWEATSKMFEESFPQVWSQIVESWR